MLTRTSVLLSLDQSIALQAIVEDVGSTIVPSSGIVAFVSGSFYAVVLLWSPLKKI